MKVEEPRRQRVKVNKNVDIDRRSMCLEADGRQRRHGVGSGTGSTTPYKGVTQG